ncbi:MAG: hypothetical protein H6706_21635 [Myxococcales bacterium]|nr:hypothetical protein [Myxococcales bacterium]
MTEDLEPEKLVRLIDKESGETLTMQVAAEFELDGKVYGVLTPAETLIRIFRETADELIEVEPGEFSPIKEHVDAALSDWGLKVAVRADEFVLEGEEPDDFYEDCDIIEGESDEGPEELFVLVEVDTGDQNFLVTTSAEMRLFPVEITGEDEARLLEDEEYAALEEIFREVMDFPEDAE